MATHDRKLSKYARAFRERRGHVASKARPSAPAAAPPHAAAPAPRSLLEQPAASSAAAAPAPAKPKK